MEQRIFTMCRPNQGAPQIPVRRTLWVEPKRFFQHKKAGEAYQKLSGQTILTPHTHPFINVHEIQGLALSFFTPDTKKMRGSLLNKLRSGEVEITSIAALRQKSDDTWWIDVMVLDNSEGCGYVSSALLCLLDACQSMPCEEIHLHYDKRKTICTEPIKNCYEKLGFKPVRQPRKKELSLVAAEE